MKQIFINLEIFLLPDFDIKYPGILQILLKYHGLCSVHWPTGPTILIEPGPFTERMVLLIRELCFGKNGVLSTTWVRRSHVPWSVFIAEIARTEVVSAAVRIQTGSFEAFIFHPAQKMHLIYYLTVVLVLTLSLQSTAHPAARSDLNFRNIILSGRTVNSIRSPAIHEDPSHHSRISAAPTVRHQYLVHLVATATDADVNRIELELKTKFTTYFPHHTYLLFATDDVAHQARGVEGVEWVGAFHPEYKQKSFNGTTFFFCIFF